MFIGGMGCSGSVRSLGTSTPARPDRAQLLASSNLVAALAVPVAVHKRSFGAMQNILKVEAALVFFIFFYVFLFSHKWSWTKGTPNAKDT